MIGTLVRLLTLVMALVALVSLSLHLMPSPVAVPADASTAEAHMVHGDHRDSADDPIGQTACAVHCLAIAALPAKAAEAHPSFLRLASAFDPPTRLSGLAPTPLGPPPKAFASP